MTPNYRKVLILMFLYYIMYNDVLYICNGISVLNQISVTDALSMETEMLMLYQ